MKNKAFFNKNSTSRMTKMIVSTLNAMCKSVFDVIEAQIKFLGQEEQII